MVSLNLIWSIYSYAQSDDDDMAPDEILIQAQKAARAAADKLTLKKPNSQVDRIMFRY